jgi:hypothetical protein
MKARAFHRALAVGMFAAFARAQADIHVTNLNDSGAGSLRQAIQDVTPGEFVFIDLAGTINLTSALVIDKDVLIEGPGARTLTIARSGPTKFRIFHITAWRAD